MSGPASPPIHLATLQPALRLDAPMPNMHTIRLMVDHARRDGPLDLVVLPEVFDGRRHSEAEDAGGDALQFLTTLARACDVHVVGGSVVAAADDGWVNRSYLIERGGRRVGHYDKQRLFSREQAFRTAGARDGIFELGGVRVGVAICADLWWPELMRRYAGQVDILCVPSRTGVSSNAHADYARHVWQALALTRALENGLAVVVSDWAPPSRDRFAPQGAAGVGPRFLTAGVTGVFDPSHRPDIEAMQVLAPLNETACVRATIDLDRLDAFRSYRTDVGLLPE